MGLPKATPMKIFDKFFVDSQKLEILNKNKIFEKINKRFGDSEVQHTFDDNWVDLFD